MSRCSNSSPRHSVRTTMPSLLILKISYVFNNKISITLRICSDGFIPVTAKIRIFPYNAIESHNVVVRKNDRILSIVFGILNIIK